MWSWSLECEGRVRNAGSELRMPSWSHMEGRRGVEFEPWEREMEFWWGGRPWDEETEDNEGVK